MIFADCPIIQINPKANDWEGPDFALTAVQGNDPLEQDEPGKVHRQHYAIRSRRWRYILCNNGEEELYDHDNDPYEWTNLAGKSEYTEVQNVLNQKLKEMLN